MYRRVPCDWFICDGIFRRIRLDAPMLLTDALEDAGIIRAGGSFTERLAGEWVYRRAWTYSTEFMHEAAPGRAFIKLTGLTGLRETLLNGESLGESSEGCCEYEVTGLLKERNTLEVRFKPDTGFQIRPVMGFSGALMLRRTQEVSLMSMTAEANGDIHLVIDAPEGKAVRIKYALSCGETRKEQEITETGGGEFTHNLFGAFAAGARADIICSVYIKNTLSDEANDSVYVPAVTSAPRGFIASGEAMTGLSRKAGANCVFARDIADSGLRTLAARHSLACVPLGCIPAARAENALLPLEMLEEAAGNSDMLENSAFWKLTGRESADAGSLPGEDIEDKVKLSRVKQALSLRTAALEARLAGRPFALDGVCCRAGETLSPALSDADGQLRPAYWALKGAWAGRAAFTKTGVIPDDGIFSSEVCYVTDEEPDRLVQIKVTAFDIYGKQLNSASYAASGRMPSAGRFITELPEDGMCLLRTQVIAGTDCVTAFEELVLRPGTDCSALPETQLLLTDEAAVNAGSCAAIYVCVNEAGYFGCLLPGEKIPADRAGEAEGLNIYF